MDVRLSPEQESLRNAAARLVGQLGPKTVDTLDEHERADKLDAAISAAGWRDDLPPIEAALVAEELGRGLADTAFVGPVLAANLRRRAGAPPSPTPETIVLDETLGRSCFEAGAEHGFAFDAGGSETALALGRFGDAITMRSVVLGKPRTAVDLTRVLAPVDVTGEGESLGTVAADAYTRWIAFGLALASADLVGVMHGATALSTDYAKARRQYGVPVGSFQAVQHLLADAHVATEGSRSIARHATWAVDALEPQAALAACAAAKAYCSRAARTVCETAIQVHGGIGNTWECLAHVFLRRALVSIDAFGGVGPNLSRVLSHSGAT